MIATSWDYADLDRLLGVEEERVPPENRTIELAERAGGIARVKHLTTGEVTEYHLQPYGWQKVIA